MNNQEKTIPLQANETGVYVTSISLESGSTQEYTAPEITPEIAIEMFGEDARESVTRNLLEYCQSWRVIEGDIISLEKFPPHKDEYVRIYIEVTLRNLHKKKYVIERHIRRLQRCAELLENKRLFSEQPKNSGLVDIVKLKERIDIVDVIGSSVELRRTGSTYKGRCPFHDDRSPSFVVYPKNNRYWCFACSEGGDVIFFVQKINNCSFREAVAELGGRI